MGLRRGSLKRFVIWGMLGLTLVMRPSLSSADDEQNQPVHRKLTPEELLRKRIAESLAGLRDSRAPHSETLVGPELNDREKAEHVLDRLSYGARPGEVDDVLKMGWQAWAKQQMDPSKIDDATCDRVIAERFKWTKMSIGELKKEYGGRENQDSLRELHSQLPECVLTRAVLSNRQFKEVMCDFWRNHFCVDQPDTYEKTRSWTDADYEDNVIRTHVFGNFGEMLFASARHPAMLEYLDNKLSRANNWNENYAREVMELHTLGADRGYNNLDVQELSKVLTGWTYDDNYQFQFRQDWHQPGYKYWLGSKIPQGYAGGVEAMQVLATHPNTAQFISYELCQYLVNDNPPPTLVRHVAGVFRESKGDLSKVYWAIISSPEFMSRDNYRAKFKTPFQFTVSALRSTSAKLDNAADVCQVLGKMGEPIYDCPDPTGYFDKAESWMDAGVLTSRWQFAWRLASGAEDGVAITDAFLGRFKSLKPEEAEQKLIIDLIGGEVGDRELAAMKEAAAGGDLPRMISIILGSPSFQQR